MPRPFLKTTNQLTAALSARSRRVRPWNTPTHIFLEVTNRCNLSCVMCGRTHDRRYKNAAFTGDISLQTVRKLEPFYRSSTFVTATGLGEPFLNPEMTGILRYLKKQGACVSMTSNGTVLDDALSAEVIDTGLDRIVFSVDSPVAETFRRIRVGTTLDQVLGNIETFSQQRSKSGRRVPYMILEFVAMAQNFEQLPEIADLAARLDFDEVIVQNLFKAFDPGYNAFYQKNKLSALSPEQVVESWEEFRRRLKRHKIRLYSPFSDGGIHSYVAQSDESLPRRAPRRTDFMGFIDEPLTQDQVIVPFRVNGWVLGLKGLPRAEIALESATEVVKFPIDFSIERPDVLPHLPEGYPAEANCGFSLDVTTPDLEAGVYTLSLLARHGHNTPEQTIARHQMVLGDDSGRQMYCTQPWTTIYVTWDGKLRTCCFNEYQLGDLNNSSASEIWRGPDYRELRQKVISGQAIPDCLDCLAGKSVPNDLRDFGGLLKV